jgi:hypothetical protein
MPAATLLLPHLSGAAAVDALHQSVFGMVQANHLNAVQASNLQRQQEAQQPKFAAVPQQEAPKAQAGARKARYNSSVTLNKQIMSACTVNELLDLVYEKRSQFDFFNISSAIARVPKLVCGNGANGVQVRFRQRVKAWIATRYQARGGLPRLDCNDRQVQQDYFGGGGAKCCSGDVEM